MKFIVTIQIMPLEEILDPQGKAVLLGLHNLGISAIQDVRIGKNIVLRLEANDEEAVKKMAEEACQKLLANLIMESYQYQIKAV